jgi:hypothetical protein
MGVGIGLGLVSKEVREEWLNGTLTTLGEAGKINVTILEEVNSTALLNETSVVSNPSPNLFSLLQVGNLMGVPTMMGDNVTEEQGILITNGTEGWGMNGLIEWAEELDWRRGFE